MIRRSFRLGLTLGLLGGLAFALAKVLGGRAGSPVTPLPSTARAGAPWPPLQQQPSTSHPMAPPAAATTWVPSEAGAPAAAPSDPTPTAAADAPAPSEGATGRDTMPSAAKRPAKKAPLKPAPAKARKAPLKAASAPKKATVKKTSAAAAKTATWVTPDGDVCPTSHPVKARLASGIFHVPGMLNYLRTRPDRCYHDAAAAEADGLRAAKR